MIALDHRGHGRGLRSPEPFRLRDCADDTAAVLRTLAVGPAVVVGYSLGGAVAQLVARDHPDVASGIVLCATANEWSEPKLRVLWSAMTGLRLLPVLLRALGAVRASQPRSVTPDCAASPASSRATASASTTARAIVS